MAGPYPPCQHEGVRDYHEWHRSYDDPGSTLSWRLCRVQAYLADALDALEATEVPVRVLSVCAGDGRDVLGVLEARPEARVSVTLLELDPGLAARARERAAAAGLDVEVRTADAGTTNAYAGALPADVVLLVGIFGNISEEDIRRTVAVAPALCVPGARLLWSRGRALDGADPTDAIRGWFAEEDFTELDFVSLDRGSRPSLGLVRYDGERRPIQPGQRIFTFVR